MYTNVYWIHQFDNGSKISIMPRPRGDDWLEEEIIKLKKQEALCCKHDLEFVNFPIVDRGVPEKSAKIDSLIDQLLQKILAGNFVVIHCRMGIGRSSIVAACVLLKTGFKTDQILQKITKARGLKVPDTDIQVQWIKNREKIKCE